MLKERLKLTSYSKASGWASKLGPEDLAEVLKGIEFSSNDENLIVGLENGDDAIIYKLDENRVMIQSIDFFTPVVDDPYLFGQIAAANSLSDIYAMGGRPVLAMNVVGFPDCLERKVLNQILKGGNDKVKEAGAFIGGGHTVEDDEPKYGLAVTGIAHPDKIRANSTARIGDKLILTKPLGAGIISTAIKADMIADQSNHPAVLSMAKLNATAAEIMDGYDVSSCTDITGFGLVGHLNEMLKGSKVGAKLFTDKLKFFPDTLEMMNTGMIPGGLHKNRKAFSKIVDYENDIAENISDLLYDPQTSGGLLIAVNPNQAKEFLNELIKRKEDAAIVGEIKEGDSKISAI